MSFGETGGLGKKLLPQDRSAFDSTGTGLISVFRLGFKPGKGQRGKEFLSSTTGNQFKAIAKEEDRSVSVPLTTEGETFKKMVGRSSGRRSNSPGAWGGKLQHETQDARYDTKSPLTKVVIYVWYDGDCWKYCPRVNKYKNGVRDYYEFKTYDRLVELFAGDPYWLAFNGGYDPYTIEFNVIPLASSYSLTVEVSEADQSTVVDQTREGLADEFSKILSGDEKGDETGDVGSGGKRCVTPTDELPDLSKQGDTAERAKRTQLPRGGPPILFLVRIDSRQMSIIMQIWGESVDQSEKDLINGWFQGLEIHLKGVKDITPPDSHTKYVAKEKSWVGCGCVINFLALLGVMGPFALLMAAAYGFMSSLEDPKSSYPEYSNVTESQRRGNSTGGGGNPGPLSPEMILVSVFIALSAFALYFDPTKKKVKSAIDWWYTDTITIYIKQRLQGIDIVQKKDWGHYVKLVIFSALTLIPVIGKAFQYLEAGSADEQNLIHRLLRAYYWIPVIPLGVSTFFFAYLKLNEFWQRSPLCRRCYEDNPDQYVESKLTKHLIALHHTLCDQVKTRFVENIDVIMATIHPRFKGKTSLNSFCNAMNWKGKVGPLEFVMRAIIVLLNHDLFVFDPRNPLVTRGAFWIDGYSESTRKGRTAKDIKFFFNSSDRDIEDCLNRACLEMIKLFENFYENLRNSHFLGVEVVTTFANKQIKDFWKRETMSLDCFIKLLQAHIKGVLDVVTTIEREASNNTHRRGRGDQERLPEEDAVWMTNESIQYRQLDDKEAVDALSAAALEKFRCDIISLCESYRERRYDGVVSEFIDRVRGVLFKSNRIHELKSVCQYNVLCRTIGQRVLNYNSDIELSLEDLITETYRVIELPQQDSVSTRQRGRKNGLPVRGKGKNNVPISMDCDQKVSGSTSSKEDCSGRPDIVFQAMRKFLTVLTRVFPNRECKESYFISPNRFDARWWEPFLKISETEITSDRYAKVFGAFATFSVVLKAAVNGQGVVPTYRSMLEKVEKLADSKSPTVTSAEDRLFWLVSVVELMRRYTTFPLYDEGCPTIVIMANYRTTQVSFLLDTYFLEEKPTGICESTSVFVVAASALLSNVLYALVGYCRGFGSSKSAINILNECHSPGGWALLSILGVLPWLELNSAKLSALFKLCRLCCCTKPGDVIVIGRSDHIGVCAWFMAPMIKHPIAVFITFVILGSGSFLNGYLAFRICTMIHWPPGVAIYLSITTGTLSFLTKANDFFWKLVEHNPFPYKENKKTSPPVRCIGDDNPVNPSPYSPHQKHIRRSPKTETKVRQILPPLVLGGLAVGRAGGSLTTGRSLKGENPEFSTLDF